MSQPESVHAICNSEFAGYYRKQHPIADCWAAGYGIIDHSVETQVRVFAMANFLEAQGKIDPDSLFNLLCALDRITSGAMWLSVHQVYARHVYLDGRNLTPEDFKTKPEGHTGGSLNMIPGYTGYMAANAITGFTRSWIMGQGHCVSAIDSVNLILDNMLPAHAERYSVTDEGLTRYVQDFYSYKFTEQGKQDSPLGSHVNPHTAGGIAEGGYLGFVQIEYPHMPLPGESLVTFLSDGAFEEQRGSDWTPRWWRANDCGLVLPIMIYNGRRIDQRSTMAQTGGTDWFVKHLELNHFDPFVIDGTDPAAFVWAIFEMEQRLQAAGKAAEEGEIPYPVRIPYAIAAAAKGAGFFNAGTNLAHDLPIPISPQKDVESAQIFNEHARKLWVPQQELQDAIAQLQNHQATGRPKEKDHPVANRDVHIKDVPTPNFQPIPTTLKDPSTWTYIQPMAAVDEMFLATVKANPHLRPRVGNPDEIESNRIQKTLESLCFRVTDPEPGVEEELYGAIITALNEEAIAAAALGNKGGINLIATYEAFGSKMHGIMRQEVIFAKHQKSIGQHRGWLSVPLVLTSHTWENGKNEQSHQDPSMAEAMMGEPSDISRVMFAADYNTTAVLMQNIYQTHGQLWTMVVSKRDKIPNLFTPEQANYLYEQGALKLEWAGYEPDNPRVILTAIGGYQLNEVLKASDRLSKRQIPHSAVYMLEPGRFRLPRDAGEIEYAASAQLCEALYPASVPTRIFVTHTRPEPLLGTLQSLVTSPNRTAALGFVNQGGTLEDQGMLFINRSSWGHILLETARVLDIQPEDLLASAELDALHGKTSPEGIIIDQMKI